MPRTGALLAALALLAGSGIAHAQQARPSPKPYTECDKPGGEFFYLVQQWPPGYCSEESCAAIETPPAKFTIHGLWPNYCQEHSGHFWPQYCAGRGLDLRNLSSLLPQLRAEWPSFSASQDSDFWEHEWDRHGTCALAYTPFGLYSQYEYFETALRLHRQADVYEALAAAGIEPGTAARPAAYQAALRAGLGGGAFLHCSPDNTLIEVYSCYDQRLQLVPCSQAGTCKEGQNVRYLAPEPRGPA